MVYMCSGLGKKISARCKFFFHLILLWFVLWKLEPCKILVTKLRYRWGNKLRIRLNGGNSDVNDTLVWTRFITLNINSDFYILFKKAFAPEEEMDTCRLQDRTPGFHVFQIRRLLHLCDAANVVSTRSPLNYLYTFIFRFAITSRCWNMISRHFVSFTTAM